MKLLVKIKGICKKSFYFFLLGIFYTSYKLKILNKENNIYNNKLVVIIHAFYEYNELNGTTDLTRNIFLNLTKYKNFFYPFINSKNTLNFFINGMNDLLKNHEKFLFKIFKNYKINSQNFENYANSLKESILLNNNINDENNDLIKFISSRSHSELFLGTKKKIFFHHTSPIASGLFDWSIFVENIFTLFHPFLIQSKMKKINLKKEFFYHLVKKHLEHESCKKILVNYKQTQIDISEVFESEIIDQKTTFFLQGTKKVIDYDRRGYFFKKSDELKKKVKFLFVNSFNGQDINFYCRGGEYAINSFIEINKKLKNSELILRSPIPHYLQNKINHNANIKVIDKWISKEKYVSLFKEAHFLFSVGIGGFTETNLHCLMNGVILIGPDDFINNEKFEDRFIDIKSINQEILKYDETLKSFRYQDNEKLFKYNFKIHNEVIEKILHFIDNKKNNKYIEILQKNYEFYEQNFKFKDMIKDVGPKIFN